MSDKGEKRSPTDKAMNSAREEAMGTFEKRYAEPPPYSADPPAQANARQDDRPNLEHLVFDPSPLEIPTPSECIAHLKLLHAFAKLRHDVGNRGDIVASEKIRNFDDSIAEKLREKRWVVFVTKAVDRFERWYETLPEVFRHSITTQNFDSTQTYKYCGPRQNGDWILTYSVSNFPLEGDGLESQPSFQLPPLDVLMVWHAYMLNPRVYLEDSIRLSHNTLWRTSFPWQPVFETIDAETFEYAQNDRDAFKKVTGRSWDAFTDQHLKKIGCPKCTSENFAAWTKPPALADSDLVELYLTQDTGYAAEAFEHVCTSCNFTITHEKLRVGKFISDADDLCYHRRPLPGTLLNINGVPRESANGKNLGSHDAFFPNRAIQNCAKFHAPALREELETLTISGLKEKFQTLMFGRGLDLLIVNSLQHKPTFLAKNSKIAVRKMLSHYWDNSSVFGIDLVGAVLRQGTFVHKMKKLDWLHSPALFATTKRLIVKYHRFVRIAGDCPKTSVVPTLDIDLAWHTHQLTPKLYYRYTLAETRKFLNHDDKIPESNLHTAFQWTSQYYEKKYGQPYSECSCWYCECTREPLRSAFLNKFRSRRASLSVANLSDKAFPADAVGGPHISAHNALHVSEGDAAHKHRQELEKLDLQYAKVCKRYQKNRAAEPPARGTDAYTYGAYGYPVMIPVGIPYAADPEPSHAGVGGGGSCAVGTCAASTSLGACAGGDGTPGCKASCGGSGAAEGGCGTWGGGGDGGGNGDGGDGGDGGGCGGCGG